MYNQKYYYGSSLHKLYEVFVCAARICSKHVNKREAKISLLIVWHLMLFFHFKRPGADFFNASYCND